MSFVTKLTGIVGRIYDYIAGVFTVDQPQYTPGPGHEYLVDRISDVVLAIAAYFRDMVNPRVMPPGGSTGQALVKTSGTDYAAAWSTAVIAGVYTFNARTGDIVLTSGDVTGALTYTPYNSTNPANYTTLADVAAVGYLTSAVTSFNTRTGVVTLTSGDVTTALTYTPYNATNPAGYITAAGAPVQSFNTRTGAITLTSSDVTTALTYTPYNSTNPSGYISGNQTITLSGDVTGSGTTAITSTLATVNANTGAYGDSTHVATFTVNGKGLTTAAGSTAIAFPVTSFNTRTGAIALTSGDVTTALGFTPGTGNGSVTSVSGAGGTTGLTLTGGPITTTGTLTLGGTLAVANGGTGKTSFTANQILYGALLQSSFLSWDNTNSILSLEGSSGKVPTISTPNAATPKFINITAGNATGTGGAGGDINITAGSRNGASGGDGGNVIIRGGVTGTNGGNFGGSIQLLGGPGSPGFGGLGTVTISGGGSSNSFAGATVQITGGYNNSTGLGGPVVIKGGDASGNKGGAVQICTGSGTSSSVNTLTNNANTVRCLQWDTAGYMAFFGGGTAGEGINTTVPVDTALDVALSNVKLRAAGSPNGFNLGFTNTATVGNVTINKISGTVNLAAAATTLTLTNSLITANSRIMLTLAGNPGASIGSLWAIPGAGSATINTTVAPISNTAISFLVIN